MSLETGLTAAPALGKEDSTDESGEELSSEAAEDHAPRHSSLLQRGAFAIAGVGLMGLVVVFAPSSDKKVFRYASEQPRVTDLEELGATPYGTVDGGIYTYGSPGTANPALPDLSHKDSCFAGLRTWTEDVLGPTTKQEDAAAISDQFDHPQVATLRLHDSKEDSKFASCPGSEVAQPFSKGNQFADWRLHWEPYYKPRLQHVKLMDTPMAEQEPFRTAYLYNRIAYKQYDSTEHAKVQIKERLGDSWTIVSRMTLIDGAGSMYDEDPMMLVQNSQSFECVVAFAGINNYGNELATATDVTSAPFCGFKAVHEGYRDELRRIIKDLWPAIQPKMGKCSSVACTGHSMGGSLCDLFAACANSGRHNDPDFLAQSWKKETPAALPEIADCGGTVYKDHPQRAERRCKCPPCPK